MNIFTFTGNLGKDCEIRVTQGGMTICGFSVAVKSGYGDNQKTTWVMCTIFGKRAEGQLPQYLTKGAQVAISGEAFIEEWQKDGVTNKMLKVNVDKLDLIGGRAGATEPSGNPGGHQGASGSPPQQAAPMNPGMPSFNISQPPAHQPSPNMDSFDDQIPF